jgi:predicted HAD superfamily Cof-like phosphohydrolase
MKSNFQKVIQFNELFSVGKYTKTPLSNVFKENPELIKLRLDLVTEEYQELKEAVSNNDIVETIDGLVDLLYVTYGFLSALNIDADKAFEIVSHSNLSKVCNTEQEAIDSVNIYLQGTRYTSPCYRPAPETETGNKKFIVYNKETGKVLKNHKYLPADFKDLIN